MTRIRAWKKSEKSSAATDPARTEPRPGPVARSHTEKSAAARPASASADEGEALPFGVKAWARSTTSPVTATMAAGAIGRRSRTASITAPPRPAARGVFTAWIACVRSFTWRTSASAVGSIRRVKAGLAIPITIASTTSGTSTAASRPVRSARPWFFGFVSSP